MSINPDEVIQKAEELADQAATAVGDLAEKAKPYIDGAVDKAVDLANQAKNKLEDVTGVDFDGDGKVGDGVDDVAVVEDVVADGFAAAEDVVADEMAAAEQTAEELASE